MPHADLLFLISALWMVISWPIYDRKEFSPNGSITRASGFVTPEKDKKEVFVHISSFAKNLPRRPQIGDTVFFYVQKDEKGQIKAVDVIIEGVAPVTKTVVSRRRPMDVERSSRGSWRLLVFCVILIIWGGATIYDKFFSNHGQQMPAFSRISTGSSAPQKAVQSSPRYTCAGKTRCSQMSSCEEATFYQQNCPGTLMDGDGDGVPCERQHCN
ncbi:MAG: cold-shock protein [Desulfobulbaceae bacterium]|nr:MAG: cold-shock protein [Desulfobulbaceae bacterium]